MLPANNQPTHSSTAPLPLTVIHLILILNLDIGGGQTMARNLVRYECVFLVCAVEKFGCRSITGILMGA